ncbi:MAG TPA: type II toxin-antitoxin system prevent-host-death family antitoxin [Pseudolabrys sp.]|jgi:prevent-host-death family protein
MKHVGIFEAKTNLSALVEEVEKGGSVVITRHGKPVAKLVPAQPELTEDQIAKRLKALKEIRAQANELKINATPEEIKSWINEGRH